MKKIEKDYCTKSPDKIVNIDISNCCKAHDNCYKEKLGRKKCDKSLKKCLYYKFRNVIILNRIIPNIYYMFVRLFGSKYYK